MLEGAHASAVGLSAELAALARARACTHKLAMSALPPKADIRHCDGRARFVPKADIEQITVLECDPHSSRITANFLSIVGADHGSAEHRLLGRDHKSHLE
jgi:hypothetical protein